MAGGLIGNIVSGLSGLLFPEVCEVCRRELVAGEDIMCLHCNHALPRTMFHKSDFNRLHQRLVGDAAVERAASWFYYQRHSGYADMIHTAKYRGMYRVIGRLGRMYARELLADGFFEGIDVIEPVPMRGIKKMWRGYNQSEVLARGLSDESGVAVGDHLVMTRRHDSQTRRGAYARFLNVKDAFGVRHGEELAGKHVLVVDDVVTTGATLLACCGALRASVPDVRISVLTLAATRML